MANEIDKLINNLYDKETASTLKSVKKLDRGTLGHIALFAYPDPKFKNQLPVYDILPLIIILGFDGTHIHGINLHYIPWTYRINFAKRIMRELEGGKILTYERISRSWGAVKVPDIFTKFAYRQYLVNRIASKIKVFDSSNYYEALVNILPKFKKQTETEVYNIIRSKIKSLK